MNIEEHKEAHLKLQQNLDILVADMIRHTKTLPSKTTVLELMTWSSEQVKNPTEQN